MRSYVFWTNSIVIAKRCKKLKMERIIHLLDTPERRAELAQGMVPVIRKSLEHRAILGDEKMNMKQLRPSGSIIFKTIMGSRAYNTYTEESDTDVRGIFVLPNDAFLSMEGTVKQISDDTNDITFYELRRYFELAKDCNPNIIEMLYSPEDCVQLVSPVMELLLENRSLFISKKAYHTFSGYAVSQIKRAAGQNKWVNNPQSEDPPDKMDFCWYVDVPQIGMLQEEGGRTGEYPDPDFFGMPMRPIPIKEAGVDLSQYNAAKMEHMENTYRIYEYEDKARGVFRGPYQQLAVESIPYEDEWFYFSGLIIYNEQAYNAAHKDWKNYWTWKKERNEARYRTQEAGEIDYDCYLESETEFLTERGWLRYDEIADDCRLATVNSDGNSFEWQNMTDRFSAPYTGVIHTHESSYTRFSVTPNHKLYLSDGRRGPKNGFSNRYDPLLANWHLETVDEYWSGRRSHKHMLTCCEACVDQDADVSDDYLKVLGMYLAEGSIAYNRKEEPAYVFLSQIENGKMCSMANSVTEFDISVSKHFRKGRNELTYIVKSSELAAEFEGYGCFSQDKSLPFELAMKLSKRQTLLLFDAMMSGDGHKHAKGHRVYCTSSKSLVDVLFALMIKNGVPCQVYGPYAYRQDRSPMYQVFVSCARQNDPTLMMSKMKPRNNGYSGWTQRDIEEDRIVCFSVPNSILITRNKGKVAIHGNSKNMQHCMRLLWSGRNILENGEPIVRFSGEKLQHLRDIRNGKYTHAELMEWIKEEMAALDAIKDSNDLPNTSDFNKINKLYREMIGA